MDEVIHILSMCRNRKDPGFFQSLYYHVCGCGLETHTLVGNYLVPMLVECGRLQKAQLLFRELNCPNEASWISLIDGYAKNHRIHHAMNLFNEIGVYARSATFHAILKACSTLNFAKGGQEVHITITKMALENDVHVGSSLVNMYVKCGWLIEAQTVIENLPVRNVVLWTALMAGYAEYGLVNEAFDCICIMKLEGITPNDVTFACVLKACSSQMDINKAQLAYNEVIQYGFETNSFIGSTLVSTYARCSLHLEAVYVFDRVPEQDLVLWNSMIAIYAEHGCGDQTIVCLEQMLQKGILPDAATYAHSIKCFGIGGITMGQMVHCVIVQNGFENDSFVNSTLVNMYVKCGFMVESSKLVNDVWMQDPVSCTALIGGYIDQGRAEEALGFYQKMQESRVFIDSVTYACSLRACAGLKDLDSGQNVHLQILKRGLERETCIGNVLVDMYAKCGLLQDAQDVFGNLLNRNEASWSSLITGYAQHDYDEKVIGCLEQMQVGDIFRDEVIVSCSLKACTNIGAIDKGFHIHAAVVQEGLDSHDLVGNTLVDMYAKCGFVTEARAVFDDLPIRNVFSWTAVIAGYACQGKTGLVFQLFEEMLEEGVQPDGITLLIVLVVCRYGGLVNKGRKYFNAFGNSTVLTIDHYNCMVDLMSSAGNFTEAQELLDKMPFQPNVITWNIMLSACRKGANIELARNIFEFVLKSNEVHDATLILMCNIFTDAHMVEDVKKIESLRMNTRYSKQNINDSLFFAADVRDIQVKDFYLKSSDRYPTCLRT